jgi:hypothetical protein
MLYLITDQHNRTFRDIEWGANITHEETNDNYHFPAYHSADVATYLYPSYDGIREPKLWTAEGENPSRQEGIRSKYAKLTTLQEHSIQFPDNEHRIVFAILCAMNLVLNPLFREWAIKYLKGEDTSKESAKVLSDKLLELLGDDTIPPDHQYFDCCHAVLAAVLLDDPALFCANAAHRAYYDSLDMGIDLNLEQIAQVANIVPAAEIATML